MRPVSNRATSELAVLPLPSLTLTRQKYTVVGRSFSPPYTAIRSPEATRPLCHAEPLPEATAALSVPTVIS